MAGPKAMVKALAFGTRWGEVCSERGERKLIRIENVCCTQRVGDIKCTPVGPRAQVTLSVGLR